MRKRKDLADSERVRRWLERTLEEPVAHPFTTIFVSHAFFRAIFGRDHHSTMTYRYLGVDVIADRAVPRWDIGRYWTHEEAYRQPADYFILNSSV